MQLHCKRSATNLLEQLLDCKLRLLASIRLPAPGYSLLTCNVGTIGNDAEGVDPIIGDNDVGPVVSCSNNSHFLNPPMFTFCSNSPSVMLKLQKECIASNELVFAYGCATHAFHNLCMDLIKHFPGVKLVLKQDLYIVKMLRLLPVASAAPIV